MIALAALALLPGAGCLAQDLPEGEETSAPSQNGAAENPVDETLVRTLVDGQTGDPRAGMDLTVLVGIGDRAESLAMIPRTFLTC
jgi:hypothetical protein